MVPKLVGGDTGGAYSLLEMTVPEQGPPRHIHHAEEEVFYVDEVDIHLNPKIGRDWMLRGTQKKVVTPGKNKKRYVYGALPVGDGDLVYTTARRKNSAGFVVFLEP